MAKPRPRKRPIVKALVKHRPVKKHDPCAAVRASCKVEMDNLKTAAGIVAQVLVHFGAGVAVARETTSPGSTAQIFATPSDIAIFTDLLLKSVVTHLAALNWDTQPTTRNFVCARAFDHGKLAYQTQLGPLTFAVILDTLRVIQEICPPGGAGGGKVCAF